MTGAKKPSCSARRGGPCPGLGGQGAYGPEIWVTRCHSATESLSSNLSVDNRPSGTFLHGNHTAVIFSARLLSTVSATASPRHVPSPPSSLCHCSPLRAAAESRQGIPRDQEQCRAARKLCKQALGLLTQFRLFSAVRSLIFPLTPLYLEFIWGHLPCLVIHTEGRSTHRIYFFLKG